MRYFREPVNPLYGISHVEYYSDRSFDPNKVKGNTLECGEATLVRILKVEGKISERKADGFSSKPSPKTRKNVYSLPNYELEQRPMEAVALTDQRSWTLCHFAKGWQCDLAK